MNAAYIYDIFKETERNQDPDLMIGLAKLKVSKPIPAGTTEGELCSFIGRHYRTLVAAYADRDPAAFEAAVQTCDQADADPE